jgi:hypothetical protein
MDFSSLKEKGSMNFPVLTFAMVFWQLPKVSTTKFMFPILKRPIRVFVTGQDTIGYDPYPAVRKKLTEPSSGTVPDTTMISEHRIQSQEWSGTSWKQRWNPASGMHRNFIRSDRFLSYVFDLGIY